MLKQNKKNIVVLVASFVIGFIIGSGPFLAWQDLIENAQLLSGVVEYTVKTPQYYFQRNLYSLPAQASSLLMGFGVKEANLSVILSGLLGGLSFTSLSLICFAFSRKIALSLLTPLLCEFSRATEFGVNYSISIVDTTKPSGQMGISFLLIAITLTSLGHRRIGPSMLGLMPAFHMGLGAISYIVSLTYLLIFKNTKDIKNFLVGVGGFLLSYGIYFFLYKDLPELAAKSGRETKEVLELFISQWDVHRVPLRFSLREVLLNIAYLVTLVFVWRKSCRTDHFVIFCRYLFLLNVTCYALHLMSYLPGLNSYLLAVLMPTRGLNVLNMSGVAMLIGSLSRSNRYITLAFIIFATLLPFLNPLNRAFVSNSENYLFFMFCGLLFFCLTLVFAKLLNVKDKEQQWFNKLLIFIFSFFIFRYIYLFSLGFVPNYSELKNWHNNHFYRHIRLNHNLLLTCPSCHNFQLKSGVGVLIEVDTMDDIVYFPEFFDWYNEIMIDMYEIDLKNRPRGWPKGTHVPEGIIRADWEKRKKTRWRELLTKYNVTGVVAPCNWDIKLKRTAKDGRFCLRELGASSEK